MNPVIVSQSGPVVITAPVGPHPSAAHKRTFMGLGITQVIIGVMCAIGGIISVCQAGESYAYNTIVSAGIYGGAWFITSGGLAIATGANANNCNVIAGLVISILACLSAFSVMCIEASITASWIRVFCQNGEECVLVGYPIMHGIMASLAFIEFIISIVHSAYCCSGSCCKTKQGHVLAGASTMTTTTVHSGQGYAQGYAQPPQYYPGQEQDHRVVYADTQKLV